MKYKVNFTKTLTVTGVAVIEADSAEQAEDKFGWRNLEGDYEHDKICYASDIEDYDVDDDVEVTFIEPAGEEVTS